MAIQCKLGLCARWVARHCACRRCDPRADGSIIGFRLYYSQGIGVIQAPRPLHFAVSFHSTMFGPFCLNDLPFRSRNWLHG